MTDAYVLGGVRTPFARCGSSLSHIRADQLLGIVAALAAGFPDSVARIGSGQGVAVVLENPNAS